MLHYLLIIKKQLKSLKINKNLAILRENKLKVSLFLFLFISPILITNLLANSESPIYKENPPPIEEIALANNNTLLPLANPNNPEPKIVKKIPVIVTAYSSTFWETWDDPLITAAGTKVRDGIVANNYLSFGTRIRMPELFGNKIFIVEDRLNSRKSDYHIDVWFPSYQQAKEFGVKYTYIEVLEN